MCGTLLEYVDSTLCGQIKNLSGGLEVASSEFSLDDLPLCSWKQPTCHSLHNVALF